MSIECDHAWAVSPGTDGREEWCRVCGKVRRNPNRDALLRELAAREAAAAADRPQRNRLLETTTEERKRYPMASGLLDYFPDALAEVARVSWLGNEKHNPGEPLHHARGKSMDHADCIVRHLTERGGFDVIEVNGVQHRQRHSASLAWRALALLQEELEAEYGFPLPRAAKGPEGGA